MTGREEHSVSTPRHGQVQNVKAAVLVGGGSRRMGRPKQALRRDGLTLVEIAVAAVEGFAGRTVLAGGGRVPPSLDGYRRLPDPPEVPGPLGGILAAMRWDPEAVWIVVACDMPLVRTQAVKWLVSKRRPGVLAVLPQIVPGTVEPLLAVYEPQMKDLLERRAEEGRLGFQDLAESSGISCPRPPGRIRDAWMNVNTMEEFRNSAVIDI